MSQDIVDEYIRQWSPKTKEVIAKHGISKERIYAYIVSYTRRDTKFIESRYLLHTVNKIWTRVIEDIYVESDEPISIFVPSLTEMKEIYELIKKVDINERLSTGSFINGRIELIDNIIKDGRSVLEKHFES